MVLEFLDAHRAQLEGHDPRLLNPLATVVLTPRFRASRHVVFLIVEAASAAPLLVAKVARLPGDSGPTEAEAANLRAAHRACDGGVNTIPRVIACEDFGGHSILLETALTGTSLDSAALRARHPQCVDAVCDWLIGFQKLHQAARARAGDKMADQEDPLEATLGVLARGLGTDEIRSDSNRLREALAPLSGALPIAFEHGDLAHPNLLLLEEGRVGVLDWELADPHGLAGSDLFFFLTYAAFALTGATTQSEQKVAFHDAFFGDCPWVRSAVTRYCVALDIPRALLPSLFALSWARCVASFVRRLEVDGTRGGSDRETARWIRDGRYYALWRHTLDHLSELTL